MQFSNLLQTPDCRMSLYLTKYEVLDALETAIGFYKKFDEDIYPSFNVEYWFVECFLMHLSRFSVDDEENFIPIVTHKFKKALDLYSTTIIGLIDPTRPEGKIIHEKVAAQQFIKKRDQRTYNRQVSAPAPQLDRKVWMNYNNWVLSIAFWEGFILSQQPDFQYVPPDNAEGDLDLFICEATKPLLGFNIKAREVRLPILDESLDNFALIPFRSFGEYFAEPKKKKAGGE